MARSQDPELILMDAGLDRQALFGPVGNELIDADQIKHGARQNMGADLRSLLNDTYRDIVPSFGRKP